MGFKPRRTSSGNSTPREFKELPVPKDGGRPARVSLIVDLGKQERDPFVDPKTKEERPQKPCQQVAIFADLVNDKVDYGGDIGVQQYRLDLGGTFAGKVRGINFQAVPVKDADGNPVKDAKGKQKWALPGASLITKLCKAVGRPEIALDEGKKESLDISLLLGLPFIATVEVKETKKEVDGQERVYKNVNYRGASPIPSMPVLDEDGEPTGEEKPMAVAKLAQTPRCITFENATKEDIQYIRYNLRKLIKTALDYPGSAMQKAIEAWEAENLNREGDSSDEGEEETPAPAPAPRPPAKKAAKPVAKPKPEESDEGEDEGLPF